MVAVAGAVAAKVVLDGATAQAEDGMDEHELKRLALDIGVELPARGSMTAEEYWQACATRCLRHLSLICEGATPSEWARIISHRALLERMRDVNGLTLFLICVTRGSSRELVQKLSEEKLGGVDAKDPGGNNALHLAVKHSRMDLIPCLGTRFKDAPNAEGFTPLHLAITMGKDWIVNRLLTVHSNNPRVKVRTDDVELSLDALGLAVVEGQINCMEEVLQYLSTHENLPVEYGLLMHLGASCNRDEVVRLLLNEYGAGPSIDYRDPNSGRSPLATAADRGNHVLVSLLADFGANLDLRDCEGRSALEIAILNGDEKTIRVLVGLGASTNTTSGQGRTALQFAWDQHLRQGESAKTLAIYNVLDSAIAARKQAKTSLRDYSLAPPRALAFQGGGAKGVGLVGALMEAESEGLLTEIERVSGTSAGAITAALFAVGYTPTEMHDILLNFNFSELLDPPEGNQAMLDFLLAAKDTEGSAWHRLYQGGRAFVQNPNPIKWIAIAREIAFSDQPGICPGKAAREWLDDKISSKLSELTGRPQSKFRDLTFGELAKLVNRRCGVKHLHVYAVRLMKGGEHRIERFASEDRKAEHQNEHWKDVIVVDAVYASMAIPGVFKPATIRLKLGPGRMGKLKHVFIDGGVLTNYPLKAFDYKGFIQPNALRHRAGDGHTNYDTLGFSLRQIRPSTTSTRPAGLIGLALELIDIFERAQESILFADKPNRSRTVFIEFEGVSAIDLDLKPEQKQYLLTCGSNALRDKMSFVQTASGRGLGFPQVDRNYFSRPRLEGAVDKFFAGGVPKETVVVLLWGERSSGKTQLARRTARHHLSTGAIFGELDFSSPERMFESYQQLARTMDDLDLPDRPSLVELQEAIAKRLERPGQKPWILIVNGLRCHDEASCLPKKGGYVLVTAENQSAWTHVKQRVPVPRFLHEEALGLFRTWTGEAGQQAELLVKELEGSPTAIIATAQHMTVEGWSAADFLKTLHSELEKLPDGRATRLSADNKVALVKASAVADEERDWLRTCAVLGINEVPLSWFEEWWPLDGAAGDAALERIQQHKIATLRERGFSETILELDPTVVELISEAPVSDPERFYTQAVRRIRRISSKLSDSKSESAVAWRQAAGRLLEKAEPYADRGILSDFSIDLSSAAERAGDWELLKHTSYIGIRNLQAWRREMIAQKEKFRSQADQLGPLGGALYRELESFDRFLERMNSEVLPIMEVYLRYSLWRGAVMTSHAAEAKQVAEEFIQWSSDFRGPAVFGDTRAFGLYMRGLAGVVAYRSSHDSWQLRSGIKDIDAALAVLRTVPTNNNNQTLKALCLPVKAWVDSFDKEDKAGLQEESIRLDEAVHILTEYRVPLEYHPYITEAYAFICQKIAKLGEQSAACHPCNVAARISPLLTAERVNETPKRAAASALVAYAKRFPDSDEAEGYLQVATEHLQDLLPSGKVDSAESAEIGLELGQAYSLTGDKERGERLVQVARTYLGEDHPLVVELDEQTKGGTSWWEWIFGR